MNIDASLRQIEVLGLESRTPLLLDDSTSVGDVIRAMREHNLGYALITADDQLTGIFTERDVFLRVLGDNSKLSQAISALMTRHPVCVAEHDPLWRVVNCMHEGGFRQLPVLDRRGRVVACVRHKDIARFMANHFADRVLNLPPDPDQRARAPEGG